MLPNNDKDIKQELKDLAPSLAKLSRQNSSDVPEGYFEQLADNVWNKALASESITDTPKVARFKFLKPQYLAIAASLVLVFAAIFVIKTSSDSAEELLSTDEILGYVFNYGEEFDDDLLYSLLEEEDLFSLTLSSDEEILDYYLEENIEEFDDSLIEDIF